MVFVAQMRSEAKHDFAQTPFFDMAVRVSMEQTPSWTQTGALDLQLPPADIVRGVQTVLVQPFPQHGLEWLYRGGLFAHWLPEVHALAGLSDEVGQAHKDVWEHTKTVVFQACNRPIVRWAALLHDIGKVPTRTIDEKGHAHFYGHAEVGARMFDAVQQRLRFPAEDAAAIRFLIEAHLRANQYQSHWTDAAVRRFAKDAGPWCGDLLDLSRADITSAMPGKKEAAQRRVDELAARIAALHEQDTRPPLLPKGLGEALIRDLGLPPSPQLGQIKAQLEAAVQAGTLEPGQPLAYYVAAARSWLQEV